MEINKDSIKVKLISNDSLAKTNEFVIHIDCTTPIKKKWEDPLIQNLGFPASIVIVNILVTWWLYRSTQKKTEAKIVAEINQIMNSNQPLILSTLLKAQEYIFEDKISALKSIVNFKCKFYHVEHSYYDGKRNLEDLDDYYQVLFSRFDNIWVDEFSCIVNEKGYLFPSNILFLLNSIASDLSKLLDEHERAISLNNTDMNTNVYTCLEDFEGKIDNVIQLIREDLHIDNGFIHEFIKEYQKTKNSK